MRHLTRRDSRPELREHETSLGEYLLHHKLGGRNGWLKMERQSSKRVLSCLVSLVCLHFTEKHICCLRVLKEGPESLGCPFSTLKPSSKMRRDRSFKGLCSGFFHPWNSGFSPGMEKTRTLATNSWEFDKATGPGRFAIDSSGFWMFGFLQNMVFLISHRPWKHKGPACSLLATGVDIPQNFPSWCYRLVSLLCHAVPGCVDGTLQGLENCWKYVWV